MLLVIDMQEGIREGPEKHDLAGVVERIDRLAERVRTRGHVVFVQHEGEPGDPFAPGASGWPLLASIGREEGDRVVRKRWNNAFRETRLGAELTALSPDRLLVAGWATDFCVDATVRGAVERGHEVVVVADAHTTADRPHLEAPRVIEHHQWLWTELVARRPVTLASATELGHR